MERFKFGWVITAVGQHPISLIKSMLCYAFHGLTSQTYETFFK